MRVDLVLPAAQKLTLVLEALGDDKVRVNHSSLEAPLTILPDQSSEVVAIEKQILVRRVERSIARGSTTTPPARSTRWSRPPTGRRPSRRSDGGHRPRLQRCYGWRHRIVGQSIMTSRALTAVRVKNGIDQTPVEGATNLPYARARYGGRTEHQRDRRANCE
jgi:hypothetical protein